MSNPLFNSSTSADSELKSRMINLHRHLDEKFDKNLCSLELLYKQLIGPEELINHSIQCIVNREHVINTSQLTLNRLSASAQQEQEFLSALSLQLSQQSKSLQSVQFPWMQPAK
jgi:hypothetical protein